MKKVAWIFGRGGVNLALVSNRASKIFISHNRADKDLARSIGAALLLLGMDPWFDEWEIQAGDSIPGALNVALTEFGVFLVLWSQHASKAPWVRSELNAAITKSISDGTSRIVPCILDDTPLPSLIADRCYIDLRERKGAVDKVVAELTGKRARQDWLAAIQTALEGMDLQWFAHPEIGVYVCCPKCRAEAGLLQGYESVDSCRDDTYAEVRCTKCGWGGSPV